MDLLTNMLMIKIIALLTDALIIKLKCKSFIKIIENKLDHTNASHSKACVLKKNRN